MTKPQESVSAQSPNGHKGSVKRPGWPAASVLMTAIVAVAMLCFGYFIWPTPYRYEKTRRGLGSGYSFEYVWRINRFTGETEMVAPYPKKAEPVPAYRRY